MRYEIRLHGMWVEVTEKIYGWWAGVKRAVPAAN